MKNVLHKNKCNAGVVNFQLDPPPIPLIKSRKYYKSDKDFVNLKLCRDPTSENSDLCEFKIALFKNGDPEEFLLFICNFNMNLEASRYPRRLVCGEALHQFDTLSSDV